MKSVTASLPAPTSRPQTAPQPDLPGFLQRRLPKRDPKGVTSPKSARPWELADRLKKDRAGET
jgi:hypothetical protein